MEIRIKGICPNCNTKTLVTDSTIIWCSSISCSWSETLSMYRQHYPPVHDMTFIESNLGSEETSEKKLIAMKLV